MPGQHGIAAFYLCLEGGERESERLAESAADPDLVPCGLGSGGMPIKGGISRHTDSGCDLAVRRGERQSPGRGDSRADGQQGCTQRLPARSTTVRSAK
jgi:hypothetical protein